ncbi:MULTISPECIES: hypothetical protein [Pasteurellaceae]|uniref:hypothetical protein n=1 Tax=Pasteurellaceae TaxID=712 RepID=UPI0030041983
MKLHLHHLDIYKSIYQQDGKFIISSYLCDSFSDDKFINKISPYVRAGISSELDYTNDLILVNKKLIEDLSVCDCYLIFTATSSEYKRRCGLFYDNEWDVSISTDDLCFLGWNIYNNRVAAIIDGLYPIEINEGINEPKVFFNDINNINEWGLLPNENICFDYLEKNKTEVHIFVNGKEQENHWEAVAVYCDKYTYKKLKELIKKTAT